MGDHTKYQGVNEMSEWADLKRYFKRLWCAAFHFRSTEIDYFGTERCWKCGEVFNAD